MKLTPLLIASVAASLAVGGTAPAQTATPAVTMQPIANPPEKAKPAHHKAKHAKKAEKKAEDAASAPSK